jgi:hypothetical protein
MSLKLCSELQKKNLVLYVEPESNEFEDPDPYKWERIQINGFWLEILGN